MNGHIVNLLGFGTLRTPVTLTMPKSAGEFSHRFAFSCRFFVDKYLDGRITSTCSRAVANENFYSGSFSLARADSRSRLDAGRSGDGTDLYDPV